MELLFAQGHARAVLPAAADLKSMTQRVGKKRGSLVIGFVGSTLYDLLPDRIRAHRRR